MPLSTFLNGRPPTRGLQWLALSDEAVVQSPVAVSDAGGGATTTWNQIGTVACRIYPVTMRGKGGLVGGQINERSTHFCSMPVGVPVSTEDQIVLRSTGGTFEVTIALETTDPLTTRVEVIEVS